MNGAQTVDRDGGQPDQVAQDVARADGRQLVDVSHQEDSSEGRQHREDVGSQGHVQHGGLVHHQEVRDIDWSGEAGIGLVAQPAVDSGGRATSGIGEAPSGPPGRADQGNGQPSSLGRI